MKTCQKEADLQTVNREARQEKKLKETSPRDYEATG